jgi:CDP-diglyceride synthetase
MEKPQRPMWLPDTQGFLAMGIIIVVSVIAFLLLFQGSDLPDKIAGAFMTLLGVLTACLKDVYSYFFGSSSGSAKKDEVISTIATGPEVKP